MYLNAVMGVRTESLASVLSRLEGGMRESFAERDSSYLGSYWKARHPEWEVQVCDAILPDGEPIYDGAEDFALVVRAEGDFPDEVYRFLVGLSGVYPLISVAE
jgi:hypothetical protein